MNEADFNKKLEDLPPYLQDDVRGALLFFKRKVPSIETARKMALNSIEPKLKERIQVEKLIVEELSPYLERNGMNKNNSTKIIIELFDNYYNVKKRRNKSILPNIVFAKRFIQEYKSTNEKRRAYEEKEAENEQKAQAEINKQAESNYEILGVSKTASQNDINRAFRKL
jgi:hypothetical protein